MLIITGTNNMNVPTQNSLIITGIQINDAGYQLPGQYPNEFNKILQTFVSTTA